MTDTPTLTPSVPQAPPAPAQPQADHQDLDPRRWRALPVILTGLFMVLLDISIVNVAIPAIRNNLSANNADIQFVVAGYALAYAVFLITGGRLGDIYGRKRLFLIGMAGFVLTSALCGLAQSAVMLDISRVAQGLMAALMFPQVLSTIQVMFPPHERARAFGLLGAIIGIATIMGPLVGGLIIRDDLTGSSWRWIFLVNLPIGIGSLFAAIRVVPESKAPHATGLDLVGVFIASLGLGLLVYPLVQGQTEGWPAWTFICMGLSPIVLAVFVLYERALPSSRFPLVQLSMFRLRGFSVGVAVSGLFIAGIPAYFFTFSLTLQVGLGFSALQAGLTTIPWSFGAALASGFSARIAPRLGKLTITIGSALLVLGMIGIYLTLQARGENVSSFDLIPSLLISGLGLGTVIAPLLNIILAGVPSRDAGSASGVLATFQQLGGAIGVAVVGVIFFSLLSAHAEPVLSSVTPQLRQDLAAAHVPSAQVDQAVAKFVQCFRDRAASPDPAVTPPSCQGLSTGATAGPVAAAFQRAATLARERDFVQSFQPTLGITGAFWFLTGLLALLLPRPPQRGLSGAGAVAH
jgi:EmrB/QacA subfamily drug resistance transporter